MVIIPNSIETPALFNLGVFQKFSLQSLKLTYITHIVRHYNICQPKKQEKPRADRSSPQSSEYIKVLCGMRRKSGSKWTARVQARDNSYSRWHRTSCIRSTYFLVGLRFRGVFKYLIKYYVPNC